MLKTTFFTLGSLHALPSVCAIHGANTEWRHPDKPRYNINLRSELWIIEHDLHNMYTGGGCVSQVYCATYGVFRDLMFT